MLGKSSTLALGSLGRFKIPAQKRNSKTKMTEESIIYSKNGEVGWGRKWEQFLLSSEAEESRV